jgi:Competence protein CoiA-like family
MFIANGPGNRPTFVDCARDNLFYTCPECREKLTLKHGSTPAVYFAHRPESACRRNGGTGESDRNLKMKAQVARLFPDAVFEKAIAPGHRADIVLPRGFVIEVQHSPIDLNEWAARTAAHNGAGYAVLWIWDLELVCPGETCFDDVPPFLDWPLPLSVSQYAQYLRPRGRQFYVLDGDGELRACYASWRGREVDMGTHGDPTMRFLLEFRPSPLRPRTVGTGDGLLLGWLDEGRYRNGEPALQAAPDLAEMQRRAAEDQRKRDWYSGRRMGSNPGNQPLPVAAPRLAADILAAPPKASTKARVYQSKASVW